MLGRSKFPIPFNSQPLNRTVDKEDDPRRMHLSLSVSPSPSKLTRNCGLPSYSDLGDVMRFVVFGNAPVEEVAQFSKQMRSGMFDLAGYAPDFHFKLENRQNYHI